MDRLLVRIVAVVAIALLPPVLFHAYAEWNARNTRQRFMHDQALELLGRVNAEQRDIFQAAAQVLAVLARSAEVRGGDRAACGRLLAGVTHDQPRYSGAFVADRDGTRTCGAVPNASPVNLADRDYFRRALASDGPVIGDYQIGRSSGRPEIQMATALRGDDGAVTGVIGVAIDVSWLAQRLARVTLPPGASAGIADRHGVIVARAPDGARFVGQPMPADHLPLLHGSKTVVTMLTAPDGVRRLAAFAPSDAVPFALPAVVGLDPKITFADVLQADRTALALLVLGALAALLLSALLGDSLIGRPAARLIVAAKRWQAGEPGARTGLRGQRGEFGQLATALEDMADSLHRTSGALRTALESTRDAVVVFDRDWRYSYVNERARALLGRDPTGAVLWELYPRTARNAFGADLRRAMDSGAMVRGEGFSHSLQRHLEWTAYPSADGLTVFCRDVTEAARMAAALRDSESRLQLAREAAGFGIWDRDYVADTVIFSETQWRLFGLTPREGGPQEAEWRACLHSDDLPRVLDARRAAREGTADRAEIEYRVVHPGGAVRWLYERVLIRRGPDGAPLRAVGVTLDVTARRQSEEALRENELRLRLSQEAGRIGSWEWDLIANTLSWSDLQCRQFGVDPAEHRQTRFETWRRAVHPDDLARCEATLRTAVQDNIYHQMEYRIVTPAGERWIMGRALLLRDDTGRALRMLGIDMDITEQKQLEQELLRLTRSLEERVQAEVAAREAAQARAAHAERMQALGQLAGGIAHDFNNVLQAVSGAMAMMARRSDDPAAIRRLAALAGEATQRGAAVTRRLLAFGRRGDLRPEPIDPAALLHDLREILAHTLGAAIEIAVEVADGLRPFTADKSQLETSLINLATNARDAMPEGGRLTFAIAADCARADAPHPAGLAPGRYVRLTVTDTGTGMDAATLARASEPFFTTKQPGAGTGLGLAMTKGFVEQSGGAMRLDSRPGEGATVALWLPQADAADPPAPPPDTAADKPPRSGAARPCILLVDDEAGVREVLAMELEEAGYELRVATSAEMALRLLDAGLSPDAIVTDLSMPGMNGVALIRAVQDRRPGLPAILLTGYAGDGAALAIGGALAGAFTLLRKPVAPRQLLDRLGAMLEVA